MLMRGSSSRIVPTLLPSAIVTLDLADGLAVVEGHAGLVAEIDREVLVVLDIQVAVAYPADGLAGLAGGEGQRAGDGLVVAAHGRGVGAIIRVIGGGKIHGH